MAKNSTVYVCTECGYESLKYWGKCPDCGSWNTLKEISRKQLDEITGKSVSAAPVSIERLSDVKISEQDRFKTKIEEFDRVLGGGVVRSSLVLIGGEPGIGKSTLLLQSAANISQSEKKVIYATAEESLSQLKRRLDRLSLDGSEVYVLSTTDINAIIAAAGRTSADLLIIDSIQTVKDPDISSAAGTLSQVRGAAEKLMSYAKSSGCAVFIVGHITKQGTLAGPKTIEHMVDTVMYFENESKSNLRILRLNKNRFGSSEEIGVFEMTASGLRCVTNPSNILLEERSDRASGSVVCSLMEGNRSILCEIQALATKSTFQVPRRISTGYEYNRFVLILAVIEKLTNITLSDSDIYLNVVGGLRIRETSSDLAVACAVVSTVMNRPVEKGCVIIGEVGLCGEIRTPGNVDRRVRDAASLGFRKAVIPKGSLEGSESYPGMEIVEVSTLRQCIFSLFMKNRKGE